MSKTENDMSEPKTKAWRGKVTMKKYRTIVFSGNKIDEQPMINEMTLKYSEFSKIIGSNLFDIVPVKITGKEGVRVLAIIDDAGLGVKNNLGRYISGHPSPLFGTVIFISDDILDDGENYTDLPSLITVMDIAKSIGEDAYATNL